VIDYYDRQGRPIDLYRWADLLGDSEYKFVASDELFDGTWVSTVWLGIDHRYFGDGPPLIFETMVFPRKGPTVPIAEMLANPEAGAHWCEQECWRYSTETEALAHHDQVVAKITEALERLRDAVGDVTESRRES
jgi:hypothetical protein